MRKSFVELRLLDVVPLELGVQVVEGLDPDVVEVGNLGQLDGRRPELRRRAQQHLQVFSEANRYQLQVRLPESLQL